MEENRKNPFPDSFRTVLLSILIGCFTVLAPATLFAQDDEDEQSSLEKIEQHAQTLKDLIEKYQKAEIDIIKKEKLTIVDTNGAPRDCDVAIFYNNGNQARFTTKGGSFEGNFDHEEKLPTRPYSIRLSGCACTVASTTHHSSLEEINEVIEKIKKVVEDEIEGKAHEKAKEYAEKGVQKIFDKLGYGASAGGFLSGFGYGASLGQPIGDYLTESINQILDTYREKNLKLAEISGDIDPWFPNVAHLSPRREFWGLRSLIGTSPQMTNTWKVFVHCGTREIPPSDAAWHEIKDPIRTPPPPRTYAADTSDEEKRIAEERERELERQEREEQRKWEQEKRRREMEAKRRQEEARKKYEEEQHRIREKAQEIMRTCPICDPIRQHIAAVTKRISETEQQIPELQNAVADAQKALEDANKKVQQAEQKLDDFRNPDSWVESGGRRITTTDLEVQKEMSRENWQEYMNGDQTAEETMDNWEQQSDPERHEQAKKRAEERLEKAVEDAKEAARKAKENLDEANKKLSEADQLLEQLNNRKQELEKLLEDCLKKCKQMAENIARGEITTYEELLEIETITDPAPPEQPKSSPEPTETPEESAPSDEMPEEDPEPDTQPETSQIPEDRPDSFSDVFQTKTASGENIFGSSFQVGAKLDWATRSSFEDAVCDQDGLVGCTVDGLTPVIVLFGETSLFNWNLTEQGIGIVPVSFGASLTLSQVDFEQNYAYGTASPLPYDVSGQTDIFGLDTYIHAHRTFKPILNLPGRPVFSPYVNVGISNLWNFGDFNLKSLANDISNYSRKHHGVNVKGGIGTDVNFDGPWGLRFNMDYTAGGADANLRFGAGITFSPRSYRLGSRFRF